MCSVKCWVCEYYVGIIPAQSIHYPGFILGELFRWKYCLFWLLGDTYTPLGILHKETSLHDVEVCICFVELSNTSIPNTKLLKAGQTK